MGSEVVVNGGFDPSQTQLEDFSSIEFSALIISYDSNLDTLLMGMQEGIS
jgi:hypothetical protein